MFGERERVRETPQAMLGVALAGRKATKASLHLLCDWWPLILQAAVAWQLVAPHPFSLSTFFSTLYTHPSPSHVALLSPRKLPDRPCRKVGSTCCSNLRLCVCMRMCVRGRGRTCGCAYAYLKVVINKNPNTLGPNGHENMPAKACGRERCWVWNAFWALINYTQMLNGAKVRYASSSHAPYSPMPLHLSLV